MQQGVMEKTGAEGVRRAARPRRAPRRRRAGAGGGSGEGAGSRRRAPEGSKSGEVPK